MPDTELREGEGQVREGVQEVQEAVQEEEVEEEVREDVLRGSVLRAPMEPDVLVRDPDTVYDPTANKWRSPTRVRVRQALHPAPKHEERLVWRARQRLYWVGCVVARQ